MPVWRLAVADFHATHGKFSRPCLAHLHGWLWVLQAACCSVAVGPPTSCTSSSKVMVVWWWLVRGVSFLPPVGRFVPLVGRKGGEQQKRGLVRTGRHVQKTLQRVLKLPLACRPAAAGDALKSVLVLFPAWSQPLQCSVGACAADCDGPCGIGGSITDAHMFPEQRQQQPHTLGTRGASSDQAAWDSLFAAASAHNLDKKIKCRSCCDTEAADFYGKSFKAVANLSLCACGSSRSTYGIYSCVHGPSF